jgi:oxalate decarboxylase/phosphoglucose isomerase-like protein (cupin superfamily)
MTARNQFDLLFASPHAQAAMMTLGEGAASDDSPNNEHPRCEQWLYVVSGVGQAVTRKEGGRTIRHRLTKGSLVLIEKGELHRVANIGRRPLRTLNLYVPPAYQSDDTPRPSAKRRRVAKN